MGKKDGFTKILAIAGTILVWLPLLAPVIFSLVRLIQSRRFLFDFLMPAEFFWVELIGGGLLFWAAIRVYAYRKLIGWSLGLAFLMLIVSMLLAQVTGLASGVAEPTTGLMMLVLAPIILYWLALLIAGVGGILLIKDISSPTTVKAEETELPAG